VTNPAPQSAYHSQRWGLSGYTIPNLVPNGAYNVRLHFVESYFTASGKRVFGVKINGVPVLSDFDIFKSAGGANVAIAQSFASTADATGKIAITFAATVNDPSVAAVEISSASTATPVPVAPGIAVNVGGAGSGEWVSDIYSNGGWPAVVTNAIDTSHVFNPAPQAVYQSQRTGTTFSYAIPNLTAHASYTVRLHLVESWFSSVGQRLFGVTINGEQALSNFDIYKAAGGQNVAIVEPFAATADAAGKITMQFTATVNNASVAGIEVIAGTTTATPQPTPSIVASPTPSPSPNPSASTSACAPTAVNPVFSGCFKANSPYHHTVASLLAAGATIHQDASAANYWNNGTPLTDDDFYANGNASTSMWIADSSSNQYGVTCSAYGTCDAATSMTGLKVHIPAGAHATTDSDHHIFVFDSGSGQELDMWGGYNGQPGDECEVGTYQNDVLTCSWGGTFAFSGNGLATVPGNSGIAGGVAYGMAAITAGDILSGHITHALGLIGPCLDNNGQYPAQQGRSTDYTCVGNAVGGGNGAEPTLRYGDMLHLKSSVNLNTPPYSNYSTYCKVVVKALQEYGAYADDNSYGYGIHLIPLDQTNPGWQTIFASMIAGGDAQGSPSAAGWPSCLNRIRAGDVETVTVNQGGNGALPH
jgi:hypothetical protein